MNTTDNPTTITTEPGTPFLEIVREFDAAPALVFRAHVEPDLVAQWLGPRNRGTRIEEFDARSGGRYRYVNTGRDGDSFEAHFRGVFHTVEPNELIIQTFEWEGAPNEVALETHRFEDLGNGRTRLTSHSVFPSVQALEGALANGMSYGINDSMDRLAELLPTL
ncbi:MAG: hypothetical protein QOH89_3555 [Pseudonocardiales bacterium]|jgi:uncharacterized protein YndB with AHSA1/START domain|nr:hypothetical protein [Pseudonocardiales bacterium]